MLFYLMSKQRSYYFSCKILLLDCDVPQSQIIDIFSMLRYIVLILRLNKEKIFTSLQLIASIWKDLDDSPFEAYQNSLTLPYFLPFLYYPHDLDLFYI